eukprot:jgi/Phyca11/39322/gw1.83.18.1
MVELSLQCAIVGQIGRSFDVEIDDGKKVSKLKEMIQVKNRETIKCDAKDLRLFLAKMGPPTTTQLLKIWKKESTDGNSPFSFIPEFGEMVKLFYLNNMFIQEEQMELPSTDQIHVLVVVPPPDVGSKRSADIEVAKVLKRLKMIEPKVLTEFIPLPVPEKEFQLDNLSMVQQSDDPIVMTPTLHEFWKKFGEFPLYYFVRMEEVVFWKVIKKLLFGEDRVVIVGSPGVGKSCFLMLLAFYLACIKRKKVLVIRRLK